MKHWLLVILARVLGFKAERIRIDPDFLPGLRAPKPAPPRPSIPPRPEPERESIEEVYRRFKQLKLNKQHPKSDDWTL